MLTFIKVAKQDSLISIQQEQIERADSIIYNQLATINECTDELSRRRKNVYKAAIGGTIGGFFLGIAVFGLALLN